MFEEMNRSRKESIWLKLMEKYLKKFFGKNLCLFG